MAREINRGAIPGTDCLGAVDSKGRLMLDLVYPIARTGQRTCHDESGSTLA